MKKIIIIILILLGIYLVATSMFAVDESQYVLIFQFGRIVKVIDKPGLHWKLPEPIQTKLTLSKKLLLYDPAGAEFLTGDKKSIVVNYFLSWKIIDPVKFFKTLKSKITAEATLGDIVASEIGVALGNYPLTAFLSTKPEEIKIHEVLKDILEKTNKETIAKYGVKIVDVEIKRLYFPEENKPAVFARMYSERERIATKYRSEGQEQARKIKADAEYQKKLILSEAYKKAEKIKGEGDALSLKIYAKAYQKDPEFYEFLRTLQAYEKTLGKKTTVILSKDSKFMELFFKPGFGKDETR